MAGGKQLPDQAVLVLPQISDHVLEIEGVAGFDFEHLHNANLVPGEGARFVEAKGLYLSPVHCFLGVRPPNTPVPQPKQRKGVR